MLYLRWLEGRNGLKVYTDYLNNDNSRFYTEDELNRRRA